MGYIIKDRHHRLIVRLRTKIAYTYFTLKVYVNDSETAHSPTYSATAITNGVLFNIPFTDFTVGDEITNIRVLCDGLDIWKTNEGVNILMNGDDYSVQRVENDSIVENTYDNPVRTEKFAINFDTTGDYSLQGVYVGNNATNLATTDEYVFKVGTATPSSSPSPTTDVYTLEFVNPNIKTLVWHDNTRVEFILKKNGVGLSGKTVEQVAPSGIPTGETNADGICAFTNSNYNVGKYSIGAYYVEDGHIVAKTNPYKDIEIVKADSEITYTNGTISRNGILNIWIKDEYQNAIANQRVSVYVNGKLKAKTTDVNGRIGFKLTKAQTYKFKVVFGGTSNINGKTVTITKVVS